MSDRTDSGCTYRLRCVLRIILDCIGYELTLLVFETATAKVNDLYSTFSGMLQKDVLCKLSNKHVVQWSAIWDLPRASDRNEQFDGAAST